VRDIITGGVLIGIGFALGGSVFLGNFSPMNFLFDGLGTFFIVKGVVGVVKARKS
jgi:hypothetical protein